MFDSRKERGVKRQQSLQDAQNAQICKRPAGPEGASSSDPIMLPTSIVHRTGLEAYLMQPSSTKILPKYVLAVTKNHCPNFVDVATKLADEINAGLVVNSRRAFKLRRDELALGSNW